MQQQAYAIILAAVAPVRIPWQEGLRVYHQRFHSTSLVTMVQALRPVIL